MMPDRPSAQVLIAEKYKKDGAKVVQTYQDLNFSKHIALMTEHTGLKPGVKVLDIGCGTGALLVELCEAGACVTGVDTFEEAEGIDRRIAEARLKDNKLSADLVTCSAMEMPFENESFDLAVTIGMLEHIPPNARPKMLPEIFRVIKRGGYLFLIAGPTNLTPFDQHIPGYLYSNWLSRERKLKISEKARRRQFLEIPWGISRRELREALPHASFVTLYGAYFSYGGGSTGGEFSWNSLSGLVWIKRRFKLHRFFGLAANALYLLRQEHCHILAIRKLE
ncbi:class I SAM-dependent methyltransferase [Gammaproteobacteria bacterium]|nr:class I SAM-dependent methyltransferase [Gammaproteobacteria bacterium]